MEENENEHKVIHRESGKNTKNTWLYVSVILAVFLVISFSGNVMSYSNNQQSVSPDSISEKALSFINNNLVDQGYTASINDIEETNGLYVLKLDISGNEYESYITKDGSLLFPTGVKLDEVTNNAPSQPTEQDNQPSQPTQNDPDRVSLSTDDDPSFGPEDAPVTIIEFSDFQCPYCARAVPTIKQIIEEYGDNVRIVFRDFPLSFHKDAQKAAEAAECADDQGKFWEMHDKIFENQNAMGVDDLKQYAENLGLDTEEFDLCLDSDKYAEEVQNDLRDGQKVGVTGTPAFFVNGIKISGAKPFSEFKQVIDQELE